MSGSVSKDIANSIKVIKSYLFDANHYFYRSENTPKNVFNEDELLCEYNVEKAFISTLVFLEIHGLKETYNKVDLLYSEAKSRSFSESKMGIEDPYLVWASYLDDYLDAVALTFNAELNRNIFSIDILSILRTVQYTITNPDLFSSPPSNESEVHLRIEGVLKCLFLNLKHKPTLTKPIKNFEPDTGLPSIKTLIEYKFISNKSQAKIVADQLLADTRGYFSREWEKFIYVIYETTRITPESEWKELLSECNVENTEIIVISGVPPKKKQNKILTKQKPKLNKSKIST